VEIVVLIMFLRRKYEGKNCDWFEIYEIYFCKRRF